MRMLVCLRETTLELFEEKTVLRKSSVSTRRKFLGNNWGPLLVEEDWATICQALYQRKEAVECGESHYKMKELSKCIGVKTAGQRAVGLGKLAWRKEHGQRFFSEHELISALESRPELRERLL